MATGRYNQSSKQGFIAGNMGFQPCDFWLKKNVGIMLCSQRVILIDGIEMSLSFVRLDRAPYGPSLRCAVNPSQTADCNKASGATASESADQSEGAGYLKTLADWLDPIVLKSCKSDELEPLEDIRRLSKAEEAELAAVLEAHSGDALALYAINEDDKAELDLPPKKLAKVRMYLFEKAAAQGSVIAMNEIGASLLYCFQFVERDLAAAQIWLEKAAVADDTLAMNSLALMHLSGMTQVINPVGAAVQLLERCSEIDADVCSKELSALNRFIALRDEYLNARGG